MSRSNLAEKSTNVRTRRRHPALHPVRTGLRALTVVSPQLAAEVAERLFTSPRRHGRPEREQQFLSTGRPFEVPGRRTVRAWQWGSGPTVVLMHGWEGRGAQLSAFVAPLVSAGLRVIAFDAPAHGDTAGRRASPTEFAGALEAVASWVGGIEAVVAHSMGALGAATAIHAGLEVKRVALIAPATSPAQGTRVLANVLDLPPSVVRLLHERIANRVGKSWASLEAGDLLTSIDVPVLVVHDRQDPDVPVEDSIRICERWPNSELVVTDGLGHRRILWDDRVVNRVADFLAPLSEQADTTQDPWHSFLHLDLSGISDL